MMHKKSRYINKISKTSFAVASALGLLMSPFVSAQTETSSEGANKERDVEVIMVTSRKRGNESIQDIGGSIQAVTGEKLASNAALGFDDYMRSVPGLSANNSGSGQTQITMRGAASTRLNHANPNVPATASIYFDETNVTTSGFNPDGSLIDVSRVEVLRGPQGTLFGASSMTGAIRVIFNEPELDETIVKGRFSTYATKGGSLSTNGDLTLNLPITDNFAVRASGYSAYKGGYIDNVYPAAGIDEDFNDDSIQGVRLKALWEVNDSLIIRSSLSFQETHSNGRPDEQQIDDPNAGIGLQSVDRGLNNRSILLPGESIEQFNVKEELQVSKIVAETFDDKYMLATFQFEQEFENLNLTGITSYFDREFENTLDDTYRSRDWINVGNESWFGIGESLINLGSDPTDPNSAVPVAASPFNNDTKQERLSQELRLSSDFDGNFNFIAGVYYEDDSRAFEQNIILPGLDAWVSEIAGPGFFGSDDPFIYGQTLADNWFEGRYTFDTKQISIFGEASFDFGDLELILGGRYYDYTQDADILFAGYIEFAVGGDRLVDTIDESGFSPKVELVYKATDDITMYGSISEGFRLGSVQQFISPGCEGDLRGIGALGANQTVDDIPTTIDSDTLINYEVGFKSTFNNGSTRVNVAAYQIDWSDARSQVFLGCGWILEGNFFDIESKGLELNADSSLTDDLSVSLNVGWNNAEISSVKAGAESLGSAGDPTPMAPEWNISVGFDYYIDNVFNDYSGFIRGDTSYTSEQYSSLGSGLEAATLGQVSRIEIPSSTVINLFTGISQDNWELSLFIRNLTDERIITGVDVDKRSPAVFSRARPRNMGVSVKFEF
ncbi:TonB-dependent receptor [Aliiglaciecola sp. SL4]|uniref:TonB-dependent receptor n=1 Tax=Aliiglaciecola sp. SL4 TaxID=3239806 RepID=UPI00355BD988